jgi:hypothetical protein
MDLHHFRQILAPKLAPLIHQIQLYNLNIVRRPSWKIRSLRAPHSGSNEQPVPEMIEHHKPKYKQHNISTNL